MGGVNHCSLHTLSFGEIPWFDDHGQIRRCDWPRNAFFLYVPNYDFQAMGFFKPITAPCLTTIIKPRNFAKRQCIKLQWSTPPRRMCIQRQQALEAWRLGLCDSGLGFEFQSSWFRVNVKGFGCRVSDVRCQDWGSGIRV